MLMNFSMKKKEERPCTQKLKGRTGHRVARLNDSMFVMGGTDQKGLLVNEVHRINCQNSRLDSLILDNTLCLEGFAFFSLQESLFLWGGSTISQFSNQLFLFDGSRFISLRQKGQIPKARANHLFTTFGTKYLIIFAGNNENQFFKDWFLLNLKTYQWRRLTPSFQLNFCSSGQMIWLEGRGILLLNQVYDQTANIYRPNQLFQFYVSDFNQNLLTILPLPIDLVTNPDSPVFTHLLPFHKESFLIFAGHQPKSLTNIHNLCFKVNSETGYYKQLDLNLPSVLGFQTIFYKNTLFIIGGDGMDPKQQYCGYHLHSFQSSRNNYKRHVCQMCKLYFDQQWIQSTKQIYTKSTLKDEYDYNYRMKMDNRFIERIACYIREEFYAFTLILNCLKELTGQDIEVTLQKIKEINQETENLDQNYQYLKIGCMVHQKMIGSIINQILMDNQAEVDPNTMQDQNLKINQVILRLKLATFKLGRSSLLVFRLSPEEVFVIFYSSSQLQCTTTNFNSFASYFYSYNHTNKQCSSNINRIIIHQNLKPIFKNHQEYQEIGELNLAIIVFCGDQLEPELTLFEQTADLETGQSSLIGIMKEEYKRSIPLIQLAFLPDNNFPHIYIEHNPLTLYNLYELLEGDSKNNIIEPIQQSAFYTPINPKIFSKVTLYTYPEEYWFKRVLIYHKGRLISHFKQPQKKLCGIVQLQGSLQLDLQATSLVNLLDKQAVENFFKDINSLKRTQFD